MDRHVLRTEPDAERVVIGSLLLSDTNRDDQCAATVFDALQPRDFADAAWRSFFTALGRLRERGAPFEAQLVLAELDGKVEGAAGLLVEAAQSVATTAHVGHYVGIVREASRQRRLVCMANDALNALRSVRTATELDEVTATLRLELADIDRGSAHGVDTVRVADVEPEPVEWLWPGRVAIGKVTLLAGDPGLGKSLLTLDIAARVSRGAAWPDTPLVSQPAGSVVLLSAEDDLADTIRPRLDAHEADVSRVFALTSLADLARDIDQLRTAIDRVPGVRVIIIDPVSAYMGRADSHVNCEVRAVLAPLAELAAEKRVAIVAVTHLRKGEGAALYCAMGSLAFVAAARAAWAVVRDKNDPKRRLLLSVKNNLAADSANGLAFAIEGHGPDGAPVVCWEREPVTVTADEALAPEPRKRGPAAEEREDAAAWLREALGHGPRRAKEVIEEAVHGHGLSKRTLDRARKSVEVVAYRPENPGPWVWRLPDRAGCQRSQNEPQHKQPGNLGNVPQTPTFVDRFADQKNTPPSFSIAGVEPSANGHPAPETEWLP